MPMRIVESGNALNEGAQRRARVAEQDPEVAETDGAPCAGHRVVEWAESRQPGQPEIAAGHEGDAPVKREPVRAAEAMQSQQYEAERNNEGSVVMIVFGGDGDAGEKNEVECAFEDVKSEDDEAEDGGGVAIT